MKKVKALIDLGLLTEQDVVDFVTDSHNRQHMEEMEYLARMMEDQYTEADYQADQANNEVLPF